MSRLLSAGFARLKKNKVFWIGTVLMFALGIIIPLNSYIEQIKYNYDTSIDGLFFAYAPLFGFISAAFCSLFIGAEHSDGALRNKLIVGHGRSTIYLSNLITCAAAGLMMCLAYIVAVSAVGIPLLGGFELPPGLIPVIILDSLVMTIAFSSIFTLLGMLNQNKAVTAVISILGVVVLFFVAIHINSALDAPEFYDNYVITDSSGIPDVVQQVVNPAYLRGTVRTVYQFLLDFIPTGQAVQFAAQKAVHLWQMPLYSLLIIILTTGGGLAFFRKKDVK